MILRACDNEVMGAMSYSERNLTSSSHHQFEFIRTLPKATNSGGRLLKSNLYNMDKFLHKSTHNVMRKRTPIMNAVNDLNKSTSKSVEWEKTTSTKKPASSPPPPPKISLDSIKLTERFLNVCRSVDYIANIMKAKAQLDEVYTYLFCS